MFILILIENKVFQIYSILQMIINFEERDRNNEEYEDKMNDFDLKKEKKY